MVKELNNDYPTVKYSPLEADEVFGEIDLRKAALGISLFVLGVVFFPLFLGHAFVGTFGFGVVCLIKAIGLGKAGILTAVAGTALGAFGLQIAGISDFTSNQ